MKGVLDNGCQLVYPFLNVNVVLLDILLDMRAASENHRRLTSTGIRTSVEDDAHNNHVVE